MEEAARARRQRLLDQSGESSLQDKTQSSTTAPSFKRPLPKSANAPSKNITENTLKHTAETIEEQASQLLEELSKSGILGAGMSKKRLTIDELTPKDANMDLKRTLEERSRKLEGETREAIDELMRRGLADGDLEK